MKVHIKPIKELKGRFTAPSSKSYSIRAFMLASCGGRSVIGQPSDCDDVLVSHRVAEQLGARVKRGFNNVWRVEANSRKSQLTKIDVGESGTALRFVLPLIARLGLKAKVSGHGTLRGRPNLFLTKTLREMGVNVKGSGSKEGIPIVFKGGQLKGGRMEIDGSLSSQFISALLITCPLLEEDTHLKLTGKKLVSLDYITMTLQVLKECGIKIRVKDNRNYFIKGNQTYKGFKQFIVPSDYGLAAFPLAAAALIPSNIVLQGHFTEKFIQADGHILPLLKRMGVRFSKTTRGITIKGPFKLKGGRFSLKDCPDLVPIMAVLALFAKGKTCLCDISHARVKESDRISDLRKELLKVGADVREKHNELIIHPKAEYKSNCLLDPHKDHRLAMAFSVLGLKIGTRIKNMECIAKSYPGFLRDIKSVGAKAHRL